MKNKTYELVADVTNYCEMYGIVDFNKKIAIELLKDLGLIKLDNFITTNNYRLTLTHDNEDIVNFVRSALINSRYSTIEPIITVNTNNNNEETSIYSIDIESGTIKNILGNQDSELGCKILENLLEELTTLLNISAPDRADYFGETYDGKFSLTYYFINETEAREIFNSIWKSSSLDTKVLLIDRKPSRCSTDVTIGREYGDKRHMYLI